MIVHTLADVAISSVIGPQVYGNICFSIKGCRIHIDQCQLP